MPSPAGHMRNSARAVGRIRKAALAEFVRRRYVRRMTVTIPPKLEESVAQLEETTARMLARARKRPAEDWRRVIGMFGDDELMKQVDEGGRRWRDEENRSSLL